MSARNGQTLATSEVYNTKQSAAKSANRIAKDFGIKLTVKPYVRPLL